MKPKITLCFFLLSIIVSAQTPKTSTLNVVLSDSIICHYMSDYGGIDTSAYVLFENSGYYFYNNGNIEFNEPSCDVAPSISGIITKIKEKNNKATLKIYFNKNKTYYSKVKLVRESTNKPWQIKSRLIYRNLKIPRKRPWLLHYSFES